MKRNLTSKLPLGLSWTAIIFLAALAIPKVVVQDFRLAENQPYLNALLSLGPGIIWVVYLLRKKVPHTFNTMLAIGLAYGVMLGLVHQLAWNSIWGDSQIQALASIAPRFSSLISSIVTGLVIGAVLGAAAIFLKFLVSESAKRPR
jgi:hypothetical protein